MVRKPNIEVLGIELHSASCFMPPFTKLEHILDSDGLEVEVISQLLEARVREEDSGYRIHPSSLL